MRRWPSGDQDAVGAAADAVAAQPGLPAKHDAFANTAEDIERAFAPYDRATVLSQETEPNKLHDLVNEFVSHGLYRPEIVDRVRRALPRVN